MDTQSRQVSWLETFPPDIWAYFCWYLPGEQLVRLLMTGATILRQQLMSPRVVKSITLGQEFVVFKSLDRLFNDFPSVEELYIHSSGAEYSDKLGLKLDSIPSGMRKLRLSGIWNEPADTLFGVAGATSKLNEHLPHLESLDLGSMSFTSLAWMAHSPQSLTKLYVSHFDGSVELPASLIHFGAHRVTLPNSSFFTKLPPSLKTFKVQNLTSLVPSTLTELKITSDLPCSCWHLLPQQLTKLSTCAAQSVSTVPSQTVDGHTVPSIPFDYFPRSITSLQLFGHLFCGPPTISGPSYFPPRLTRLEILGTQLSPETAKLLPSSLTFLQIGNLCERVCEHLPNSLKRLIASETLMTPNFFKFLPKSLISLQLYLTDTKNRWFDDKTGEGIPVKDLPEFSIHHQNCVSRIFDWKDHAPVHSTLTELSILNAHDLGDAFLQHSQVPNLTELSLRDCRHFTDLSIHHLPPHLTILDLESAANVSGKSFKFLPRSLTSLNLPNSESIFDSDIQNLPRTLKRACLINAIHLTDVCISDLPPHLEWLNMNSNSQITTFCFRKLPSSLRSTKIDETVVFANWGVHSGVLLGNSTASTKETRARCDVS